jgi:acyl-CoA synthetase (AMP-forming)/AMP-acid ligase II
MLPATSLTVDGPWFHRLSITLRTTDFKIMVLELRSLIAAGVQHNPDKDALLACGRKSATYKDLLHQIDKTACWLTLSGVKRADRVVVVMPNGAEMASLFLGVSSVSACAPLNPAYKASEFEFFCRT